MNNQANSDKIRNNLNNINHIIAVLSGKGGVGKSTVATNLALTLAGQGYQVGLLDSDIHGPTIPTMLGLESARVIQTDQGLQPVQATENLKVLSMGFLISNKDDAIIWRGPMKMGAIKQLLGDFVWGDLDFLIIDLPPGTGDEPLSIAQLIPKISGAIIVTTPQDVALVSVRKSITFVKRINIPIIGIIENMSGFSCPHCGKEIDIFKSGGGKQAAHDLDLPFLGKIPLDPRIVEMGDAGQTSLKNDKQIASSFARIVEQMMKQLEKKKE
jgi:ATP-binding protein involved in chromosome partitioning